MHIEYYDNQIPEDILKATYGYLQTQQWQSSYRSVPDANVHPLSGGFKTDLAPYTILKTVYRAAFGHDYVALQQHSPILKLFDYLNNSLFDNKFELTGKPVGMLPQSLIPKLEKDDYAAEKQDIGHRAYMKAQPYEPVKRTRIPYRDWDDLPLDDSTYYTIAVVANLVWNPVWHGEMFFYRDDGNNVGEIITFMNNIPGRVIIYDSRCLHNEKATSTLAPELAQRIYFRVKLKEGMSLVRS